MGQRQPKTHSPVDGRRRYNNFAERCNIIQHLDFVATWHGSLLPALPPPTNREKRRAELFKFQMKKANPEMLSPMSQSDLNLRTSLYTLLVRNV